MGRTPPDWFLRWPLGAWTTGVLVAFGNWFDRVWGRFWKEVEKVEGGVLILGFVGDSSMRDPKDMDRALGVACEESDIVVQLGDVNYAYDVVKKWKAWCDAKSKKLIAIPGNHDRDDGNWDKHLGPEWRKTWYVAHDLCYLIGLDNSGDEFGSDTWSMLQSVPEDGKALFVFAHKPTKRVVLPNGAESGHIMGEGKLPCTDAERLDNVLRGMNQTRDVLLVHGHYHDFTDQQIGGLRRIIDGRGGAGGSGPGELGWTRTVVTKEGFVLHRVDLT